jgi:hypothetical protein
MTSASIGTMYFDPKFMCCPALIRAKSNANRIPSPPKKPLWRGLEDQGRLTSDPEAISFSNLSLEWFQWSEPSLAEAAES